MGLPMACAASRLSPDHPATATSSASGLQRRGRHIALLDCEARSLWVPVCSSFDYQDTTIAFFNYKYTYFTVVVTVITSSCDFTVAHVRELGGLSLKNEL